MCNSLLQCMETYKLIEASIDSTTHITIDHENDEQYCSFNKTMGEQDVSTRGSLSHCKQLTKTPGSKRPAPPSFY